METIPKGRAHRATIDHKRGRPPRGPVARPAWQEYSRMRAGSWIGGYRKVSGRRR